MLKPGIESALNDQMNREFYSSYLYLAMSTYFESVNLKGFAHWLRIQAQEETEHAMKFYEHLTDRGGRVVLQSIQAPPSAWKSHKTVFDDAYHHEQKITEAINQLVDTAKSDRDHATENFLQWFVKEQVEEEASTHGVLQKLQLAEDSGSALLVLDSELGKRAASK